jgi:hypothetical protein
MWEAWKKKIFGGASHMTNLLRMAVQKKRQYLMDELLKLGVYKKEDKHLYELTLNDLEKEYRCMEMNVFSSKKENFESEIQT